MRLLAARAMIAVAAAIFSGCADRDPIHPLSQLLYRCAGKWEVDSSSAEQFPELVAGRETIEIQITERLQTPSDGGWHRGTTYGHGLLTAAGATCPIDLATTATGLLHPYIRYSRACAPSIASEADPDGFAFCMYVIGGSSGTDSESDYLYVDYRRERPTDSLYPGRELVLYTRVSR